MHLPTRRKLLVAACCLFFSSEWSFGETIIKLNLGPTGPDIRLTSGVLTTVNDGNVGAASPGDQDTSVNFEAFAKGLDGIVDIFPPDAASFSLSGVDVVGAPFVLNQGATGFVVQATNGGVFELFDPSGELLIAGTLESGSLHGPTGSTSGTSSFLTAELGTFTGPLGTELFDSLIPNSASLAISLSDVVSGPNNVRGLLVANDVLQDFRADATANIGGQQQVPEPASWGLLSLALLGVLRARRRR